MKITNCKLCNREIVSSSRGGVYTICQYCKPGHVKRKKLEAGKRYRERIREERKTIVAFHCVACGRNWPIALVSKAQRNLCLDCSKKYKDEWSKNNVGKTRYYWRKYHKSAKNIDNRKKPENIARVRKYMREYGKRDYVIERKRQQYLRKKAKLLAKREAIERWMNHKNGGNNDLARD